MTGKQAKPVTIVSLTKAGSAVADRVLKYLPDAQHLHQPKPFTEIVQARFQNGHRLILIGATGIAVRTLAPVLKDKHQDPAVLVLDEAGQHIIPLLSGHEGGANTWGTWLAQRMGAQCIVTGQTDYRRPIHTIGIGCDRGCPIEQIEELAAECLPDLTPDPVTGKTLFAVASIDLKQDENAILEWAKAQAVPTFFYSAAQLNRYQDQLSYRSEVVYKEVGCYGVAEAAALAAAEEISGQKAELWITKQKKARATFSVARAYLSEP